MTSTDATPNSTHPNISVKTESSVTASDGEQLTFQAPSTLQCSTANLKRPISLDLKNAPKKTRLVAPSPLIIGSPETQNIKPLTTPDLEKILHLLPTPQPGLVFQTKAASVTSEQEAFGKGFEEALHSLHNNNNKQSQTGIVNNNIGPISSMSSANPMTTVGTGVSGGSFTYTNLGITEKINLNNYVNTLFVFMLFRNL